MSDDNNPTISSTMLELAFVAWQVRRNNYDAATIDLDQTGSSWEAFERWWGAINSGGITSLRDLCWRAWIASAGHARYDDPAKFGAWWQIIVDAQPRPT
jgi:hypothetical protein